MKYTAGDLDGRLKRTAEEAIRKIRKGMEQEFPSPRQVIFLASRLKEQKPSVRKCRRSVSAKRISKKASSGRAARAASMSIKRPPACSFCTARRVLCWVKCQEDRSQAINRYLARRLLLQKIESQLLGKKSQEQQARRSKKFADKSAAVPVEPKIKCSTTNTISLRKKKCAESPVRIGRK